MEQDTARAPMITRDEAQLIAEKWVNDSAPAGVTLAVAVHEFDLGYVVTARPEPGAPRLDGTGRAVINKYTGERSVWPGLPVQSIIDRYRARWEDRLQTVWTWNPADQARWELQHSATPSTTSHVRLARQTVSASGVKGDEPPRHHRLVAEFIHDELRAPDRVRGDERCSEAAAISDALHAEDARREATGSAPITLAEARAELFGGGTVATFRVREPGDPAGGTSAPPCRSCAKLLRHFGLAPSTQPA